VRDERVFQSVELAVRRRAKPTTVHRVFSLDAENVPYTLARAPYRFAFIATFPITRNSTPHASPLISDRHSLARRRCFFSVG
jgi:hypothetical protein